MWNKLSMKDRANYIRLAVRNNIKDLDTIRNIYNQYATGGYKDDKGKEQVIINPNDKFLYHRDFADVYQDQQGRRYSVYTEDDSLPTVNSNQSRRNLEKPLWGHIQKQYDRNSQGMKTIEDAVTWGGNIAGASALAVGTAPIWLPYAATAGNVASKVGKHTLQGLDWLFNPTTYRGALLSSYVAAEGVNNFKENPNIETGIEASLGLLPVSYTTFKKSKNIYSTLNRIKDKILKIKESKKPNNIFKSELDWSENWFKLRENQKYDDEDILALKSHIPEYLDIEKRAKSNGTWLKMPDGTKWTGDPRSWIQLMSKDGQKLSKQIWWHGDTDRYINSSGIDTTPIENGKRVLWGSSQPHIARGYTLSDDKVYPIALKGGQRPIKEINAEGRLWREAYKENGKYYDTNFFSRNTKKDNGYLIINNVVDPGPNEIRSNSRYFIQPLPKESYIDYVNRTQKGNDIIIGKNTPRKYLLGNNGNFDLNNPNVYKGIIPLIGASIFEYNNNLFSTGKYKNQKK